ncbi:glycogen/starch synthase, partial [Desulfovibrio sp.]
MRVLMFGWEFSPFKSGGLGTACQGMATALAKKGTEIFFVLPRAESDRPVHLPDGLTMFSASGTRVCTRSARLRREEDVREIWHDRQYTKLVPGFRDEIEEIWREKLHLEYIDSPLRPYLNSGSYLKEHRELQRLLSEKRLADPTLRTVLQHEGPEREHLLREIAETREQCETLTLHG